MWLLIKMVKVELMTTQSCWICKKSLKLVETEYFNCEKELREKTEEVEKQKIEIKDLNDIFNLKDKLSDIGVRETESRDDNIVNDDENEWTSVSNGKGMTSLKKKNPAKFNC